MHFFTDCANIIKKIKKKWGDFRIMSNRKERNRQFQISLSKKMVLRRQRRNGRIARRKKSAIRHGVVYTPSRVRQQRGKRQTHTLTPPDIFSLFQNSAETVAFFDKTVWTIRNCKVQDSIFFDLSKITELTTDAIMYLIAVIKNMRRLKTFRITCRGNLPIDENARDIIERSGFYSYMQSSSPHKVTGDSTHMKISSGTDADGQLASSFCDFVQKQCNMTIKDTKKLYPMLIELMTNTHQHAYRENQYGMMERFWYVSAWVTQIGVHFVFLDTGVGIPATVHKKVLERMAELVAGNDAKYIESTLLGAFRTETKQLNRGKGLPGIYEDARNNKISNLCIVSNKGKCTVVGDGIRSEKLNTSLEGTLFVWDILEKEDMYDYH